MNDWFAGSSSFGFGVEGSGEHCSYRIYCERWDAMVADLMTLPSQERHRLSRQPRADWPVLQGLKWNPLAREQSWTITGYGIAPLLHRKLACSTFLGLVDRLFPSTMMAVDIRQLVEGALARAAPSAQALMLKACGDGVRDSLDLNLGDFAIPLSAARDALERIMTSHSSPKRAHAVSETVPWMESLLTHLSVGYDRQGRRFLTIYFLDSLDRPLVPAFGQE